MEITAEGKEGGKSAELISSGRTVLEDGNLMLFIVFLYHPTGSDVK